MMTVDDFDRSYLWRFRASLVRVKDADTIVVLADTGYAGRHEAAIRLVGVNADEENTPTGQRATAWLGMTLHTWTLGRGAWPLRVVSLQRETVVTEVRSFERYVGIISLIDAGGRLHDLGELLVAAGHAVRVAP